VRRRHDGADTRPPFWDRRIADPLREHAALEQPVRKAHRQRGIADDDRRDRTLARSSVEPERLQPLLEERGVLPERLHQPRLVLEHIEGRQAAGRDRRRMRRREQKRSRPVVEKLDERTGARDVSAEGTDRLRQRTDLHVHASVQAEVIHGPAAVLPEHAARVRIVDHHDAAELIGHVAQLRQRAQVSVHAEDAVGNQEHASVPARQFGDDPAGGTGVTMRKDLDRRPAEPRSVDDAGVIQLIRHDEVIAAEQRRHCSRVRGEAALEDDGGLRLLERCKTAFELQMDLHRPGDGANRPAADTIRAQRFERSRLHVRVGGEPQVVVGREIDDLPMVERAACLLRPFQHTQRPIEPRGPQAVQFLVQVCQRVGAHGTSIRRAAASATSDQVPR
jgi:hypothetical protein